MNDQPLDICLRLLAEGESLEACLTRFPEQRQELEPLLAAAIRMQSLRTVSAPEGFRQAARERLLAQTPAPVAPPKSPWQRLETWMAGLAATVQRPLAAPVLVRAAILVVLILGGLTATSYAAQSALPGNSLYSVKRLSEQVQLRLAPDPLAYRLDLAQRRLDEAEALQDRSQAQLVPSVLADYEQTLASWEKARAEAQAQVRSEDSQRLRAQLVLLNTLAEKAPAGQADAFAESQAAVDQALRETQAAPAAAPSPAATALPSATPTPTPSPTAAATPTAPTRGATPVQEPEQMPGTTETPASPTPAPVASPTPMPTARPIPGATSSPPPGGHAGPPRPPLPPDGTPAPTPTPLAGGSATPPPTHTPGSGHDGPPPTQPPPPGGGTPAPTEEPRPTRVPPTPGAEPGGTHQPPGPGEGPRATAQPPGPRQGPGGAHVPEPDQDATAGAEEDGKDQPEGETSTLPAG